MADTDNPTEPSTTCSGCTVHISSKAAEAFKSLLPNKQPKSKKTEKKTKKCTADEVQSLDKDSLNDTSAKKPSKIKKVKELLTNVTWNKKKKESNKTVSEVSTPVSSMPAAPSTVHDVIEIESDDDVEGETTSSSSGEDSGTDEGVESADEPSDAELGPSGNSLYEQEHSMCLW
ncbi:hypothetical protein CPC08DRAFT_769182 [Agrocybe pediades]|nr:hypothetical protein CPC08DRAFT_769182 [Agrocybe pediades]